MVNNFSLAINEMAPEDQVQQPKEHEYSPLFKDFQNAEMSGKKFKKHLRFLLKELGDPNYSKNIEKHISLMNLLKIVKQMEL